MEAEARIKELEKEVLDLTTTVEAYKILVKQLSQSKGANETLLQRRLETLKKMFSSSTEQLELFNDAEVSSEEGALEDEGKNDKKTIEEHDKKVSRKARCVLPSNTPVVDIYDDSTVSTCPRCGSEMVECGEKVYESVSRVNYTIIVRKHVKQFTCPYCVPDSKEEGRITVTAKTGNMLDGTICDPTLLASIITNKFKQGLPLYRQQAIYSDIALSRKTMSAWIMNTGERLRKNMDSLLLEEIYSYPLVNMDETVLKVIGLEDDKGKKKGENSKSNAFMVVRASVKDNGSPGPVLFTYSDNRRNETILNIIGKYNHCLQTDGLSAYARAGEKEDFTHLGCMVHARRKAYEANGKRTNGPAFTLLEKYRIFFHKESELIERARNNEFSSAEKYIEERKAVLLPLMLDIKAYCEEQRPKALKGSKLNVAFSYPLERWDELTSFLDYAYATSSNQRAENAIRPFAVCRKNFLFCDTENGAKVSAFFYSLVETTKAMGIDTEDYLTFLFMNANRIEDGDKAGWRALLPGCADISSVSDYRKLLLTAKPDPNRTEPYILRGKRV